MGRGGGGGVPLFGVLNGYFWGGQKKTRKGAERGKPCAKPTRGITTPAPPRRSAPLHVPVLLPRRGGTAGTAPHKSHRPHGDPRTPTATGPKAAFLPYFSSSAPLGRPSPRHVTACSRWVLGSAVPSPPKSPEVSAPCPDPPAPGGGTDPATREVPSPPRRCAAGAGRPPRSLKVHPKIPRTKPKHRGKITSRACKGEEVLVPGEVLPRQCCFFFFLFFFLVVFFFPFFLFSPFFLLFFLLFSLFFFLFSVLFFLFFHFCFSFFFPLLCFSFFFLFWFSPKVSF